MSNSPSPAQRYALAIRRDGFTADPGQARAVDALEACFRSLHDSDATPPTGVYLWGPVGRGKTWLMDLFHGSLQVPARRQHFHHFMQWVHRRLFALAGVADPLRQLAAELAGSVRVLCFDELFVTDIGDAMLLGGLFQALFAEDIVLVATGNQPPAQLYAGGFNRDRFLPAITALQRYTQVVAVDGGRDHRLQAGARVQRYWVNAPHALADTFARLSGSLPISTDPITLHGRTLPVLGYSNAALWLRFADLCGQPFAAADFIALCDCFPTLLLGEVPALGGKPRSQKIARGTEDAVLQVAAGDRQLPPLTPHDDSVRRFIALVDECYDRGVPLHIEARVPLAELYTEGHLVAPFRRTLSRLQAMQFRRFPGR